MIWQIMGVICWIMIYQITWTGEQVISQIMIYQIMCAGVYGCGWHGNCDHHQFARPPAWLVH